MSLFVPGTPRIALLDSNGNKLRTLYLPPPDRTGGIGLQWVEKAFDANLIDGSESCRRLGWLPQLKLKWSTYNDVLQTQARPIGGNDGDLADINSLLALLDSPVGTIKVSPGPSAGGFVVNKTTISEMSVDGPVTTDLTITLRGGAICASKVLGAF